MKERPILMSAPMVRALLDGSKTQTRRVARPRVRPSLLEPGLWSDSYILDPGNREWLMRDCPYGVPGDRLWVRESFVDMRPKLDVLYAADCPPGTPAGVRGGWRPSIFMPRDCSRLTLEITDVRVQRVQEISEDDAEAEGVEALRYGGPLGPSAMPSAIFRALWDSLNANREGGAFSWDRNPWVWAISFRRITS